jgi:Prealbumin-like fold domain
VLPSAAATPALAPAQIAQPTPGDNPAVPEECGLNITVVLDASGSIDNNQRPDSRSNPHNSNKVRDAARTFLDALKDTGSQGRLVDFATGSRELVPMSLITGAGLRPGGTFDSGLNTYYRRGSSDGVGLPASYVYRGGDPQAAGSYRSTSGNQQWTNWQEGLEQAAGSGTQLLVFITDGDPTAVTSKPGEPNGSTSGTRIISNSGSFPNEFNTYALRKAMNVANGIKTAGTRMLVVGVGSALGSQASVGRLKDIAGPSAGQQEAQVWTGSGEFDINSYGVTTVTDFNLLSSSLRKVATALCSPSLTITKLAQSAESAQHVPVPDWGMTVAPTVPNGSFTWTKPDRGSTDPSKTVATNSNGQSQFQWNPVSPAGAKTKSIARVTEQNKADYTFSRAECRRLDDGVPSNQDGFVNGMRTFTANDFDIALGPDSIGTCTLYNDFNYQPALTVTKRAVANPVRGDGTGWDQTYAFTLTNPGNTPLSINLSDPKCRPGTLTGPTGDLDSDGKLDTNETWTYTCKSRIVDAVTDQPLTETNTVTVVGTPPGGNVVTRTATTTVDVKTPAMQLQKTAFRKTDPDRTPIGPDDVVSAGIEVTYVYTLRNTGNDNIQDLAAPVDDKCGPLTRTSGSGTTLGVGQTWTYECTSRLLPSSTESQVTNKVTATGTWSGACPDAQQPPCQNNGRVTTSTTKTISVQRTATINVIKAIEPGPAEDQAFAFTASGRSADVTSFSLNPGASPATPSQVIRFEPIPGNPADSRAVITEAGPPDGYELTGITCTDQDKNPLGTVSLGSGTATLDGVQVGDNITCTFVNQPLPRLTVVKATSPTGAPGPFDFSVSRPAPFTPLSPATFNLGDRGSQSFASIPISGAAGGPGRQVTVEETALPAGWGLNQVDCGAKPFTQVGNAATLSLDYGDDVTCTFTNHELAPATITIAKLGPKKETAAFPFTISGTGLITPGQPGTDSFSLQIGKSRNLSVRPAVGGDDYTITEAPLPAAGAGESDWARTSIECRKDTATGTTISGDLASGVVTINDLLPGEHVTCKYVNERLPRLTIAKHVVVANGQSGADQEFTFTQTGLSPFGPLGNDDTQTFPSVAVGAGFSVTEDAQAGWSLTGLQCSGPGSTSVTASQATGTVSSTGLVFGDDVRCDFVNTKAPTKPAVLTVVKQVDPAGTAPSFGFTLQGFGVQAGDQAFSLQPDALGDARRTITVVPEDAGSTYALDESTLPAGWDFSRVTCRIDKRPVAGLTGPDIQITLLPGSSASCTYVNKPQARFTVVKKVSVADGQTGADQTFTFTQTGLGAFGPLGDGERQSFTNLANGSAISVTEATVSEWTSTITCAGTGSDKYVVSDGGRTVTPTGGVASGDDVTCLYTNTKDPSEKALLTVVKHVEPATNGPAFGFTLAGTPGDPASGSFDLQPDASGTAAQDLTLSPRDAALGGTDYTVTEAGEPGWDLTQIECQVNGTPAGTPAGGSVTLNLSPGDRATCTYTNKPKARLTITKTVSVGTGQSGADRTFAFTQTGLSDFGPLGNDGSQEFLDLTAGSQIGVDEPSVADWTSQVTCTGPGSDKYNPTDDTVRIGATVASGDDVTCHYVNTKDPLRPALLTVTKTASPSGERDFDFSASGVGLTTVGQPGSTTFALNPPAAPTRQLTVHPVEDPPGGNTYTIDEAIPNGWVLRSLTCTVVKPSGASSTVTGDTTTGSVDVDLEPGDTGSCVYDNEELASLTITKLANPDDGTVFDFSAAGASPGSFQLGNGQSQVFTGLAAGTTVQITEDVPTDAPDRWTLVGITCTGNSNPVTRAPADSPSIGVTVAAGEDVTCTYSDARVQPALITVTKSASPPDGTAFGFTLSGDGGGVLPADASFTLAPDGGPAARTVTVHPPVGGETYTLEEILTGQQAQEWQLTDITCNRSGDLATTANPAAFELRPGDSISCAFVNRRNARLSVLKVAPDDPTIRFPITWGPSPLTGSPFALADGEFRTQFPLLGGNFFVEEQVGDASFPKDWYLAGDAPLCIGTAADPDLSRPHGANLQVADGEDVACLFLNFYDYRPDIQVVKSSNRDQVLEGGEVTYSYRMTNTGNTPLEPDGALEDVLVDDKCAPVTRTVGTGTILSVGEAWEFTCTSTGITDDVTNTATGRMISPPAGVPVTGTDTHTVTVLQPRAELRKVADRQFAYKDDTVTYTYQLENTGDTPLRVDGQAPDGWLTDDRCAPVAYVDGDANDDQVLDVGETWTFTCSATLQVTTTNTVTTPLTPFVPTSPTTGPAQVGPPVPHTATYTVTVPTPGIDISKRASAPGGTDVDGTLLVPAGSTVTFDYDVTSGSADTPMDVLSVIDNKCSPVVYRSGDTDGDGLIDVDETWGYSCAQVFEGEIEVTNTAVVTAREPKGGRTLTATSLRKVRSYLATITVEKSPDRAVIRPGDPVTYTFLVSTSGPTAVSSITVVDDRCSPTEYRSGDSDADRMLDPGETWTYTCVSALSTSTINRVTVTGTPPGGGVVTNTSTTRVEVRVPSMSVVKTGSATQVTPGAQVTYDYEVSNTGDLALAEVKERISDDRCAPVEYVSGDEDRNNLLTNDRTGEFPDETWRFRCTTQLDETTTNTVTTVGVPVSGGTPIGPPVTATDTWTVTVPNVISGGGTTTPLPGTGGDLTALLAALGLLALGSTLVLAARVRRRTG